MLGLKIESRSRLVAIFFMGLLCYGINAVFADVAPTGGIQHYSPVYLAAYDREHHLLALIRSYENQGTAYYLTVDSNTLVTQVMRASDVNLLLDNKVLNNSNYFKMLERYSEAPYPLVNYGLTRAGKDVPGVFLTIDLCPSHKLFEQRFFETLVAMSEKEDRPIPIAISVTGLWMIHHSAEMNWLLAQEKNNKLQIIWVNHSFHHPVKDHFLLAPGINFDEEVFDTEKLLLAEGEVPSVFFRFPGLESNQELILKLREFGLIAVGSDAWLAKGQKITQGSIILVHGNSNEPLGIKLIMPMLQADQLHLLPLLQAL
ncbi:MAG: hypothetical protein A2X77_01975 [Gammaproteobacteria bacterium GWE2_42_36]|nr:MAG: hypothetical protein A2X77_01975 [Gammaproteobacteria bacterium GWE2_42_36]